MGSKNRSSFLRPLKNKGFKEEIVTKIGVYDILKCTPLESNKSLPENLCAPGGARATVRHGAAQSQSVDACPFARATGGPAHPWRCPSPLSGGPGPAARRLGG